MHTALPTMLMMFISTLICIEIRELPMLRNNAAPALYSARNGSLTAIILRYNVPASSTSASMEP